MLDRKVQFTSVAHLLRPEFLKETFGMNNEGKPSDRKYTLESPTERSLDRVRCYERRSLPVVFAVSCGRTLSCSNAARQWCEFLHCRQKGDRSLSCIQQVR